jgi:uncharacterized protein YggE
MRFLVIGLALLLLSPAVAAAQTDEHTLSVIGRGQVELRPDRGSFSIGVVRRAPRPNPARSHANARVRAIVSALRSLGVEREQITTSEVSIVRYGRRLHKHGPLRVRYRASVSLDVAVEGIGLLGRAIDAASRHGASAIYGPQLSLSPELRASGRREADAGALEDARARADAAAAAAGQRVVGVQSIDLDPAAEGASASFDSAASSGGGSAGAPTRVFAGRRRITSRARVTYVIEPAEQPPA